MCSAQHSLGEILNYVDSTVVRWHCFKKETTHLISSASQGNSRQRSAPRHLQQKVVLLCAGLKTPPLSCHLMCTAAALMSKRQSPVPAPAAGSHRLRDGLPKLPSRPCLAACRPPASTSVSMPSYCSFSLPGIARFCKQLRCSSRIIITWRNLMGTVSGLPFVRFLHAEGHSSQWAVPSLVPLVPVLSCH